MPTRKTLKTPDAKMKLLEEKLDLGTWTWDLETSELVWSTGLCRILGVNPNTVVPNIDLYQSLVHPDDQLEFDDAVLLAASKKLEHRRFRIIRPDGMLRVLESKAHPHFNRDGKAVMVIGVIRDITEEEQSRLDCILQKETAKALTKLLGGDVWRAYPNGKLIETVHWTKLTGQTPQETHDWEKLAAIHPEDRSLFREAWKDAIEHRSIFDVTIRIRLVNGTYQCIRGRAFPVLDAGGSVTQWIGHTVIVKEHRTKLEEEKLLTSAQIRASRAFLDWTAPELAARAAVSFSTVRRMEHDARTVKRESLVCVKKAFQDAGICYHQVGDGEVAISLKQNEVLQAISALASA
ncbi:PAS domain-containing protein [Rhizobium skierniewicense]|uniref:PAS domain-containing protein n=1 Tax=Rhizobium skierniewicense TaxID=984260 RepID=UPI001AED82FF|nr:PAS domain-containing protein [Rhizobium skierniewicense]NTF32684.1 PAS domain-containing protein [Rhizobium skierniewicense]